MYLCIYTPNTCFIYLLYLLKLLKIRIFFFNTEQQQQ